MIRVQDVWKSFHRGATQIHVLRGIDFEIPRASFVFVIGPSGSGKSSLLYLLGAMDEPTRGQILIDDENIADWSAARRDHFRREDVGFIFQSFNLLENLGAVDNVLVPDLAHGVTRQRQEQARQLLCDVGLGHRLDHRPAQLSGGEQQRVAIARALLKQPRLVLADEPTGELDTTNGREIFTLLRRLQADQQATVISVTHDERYIEPGDLVIRIRDGLIENG